MPSSSWIARVRGREPCKDRNAHAQTSSLSQLLSATLAAASASATKAQADEAAVRPEAEDGAIFTDDGWDSSPDLGDGSTSGSDLEGHQVDAETRYRRASGPYEIVQDTSSLSSPAASQPVSKRYTRKFTKQSSYMASRSCSRAGGRPKSAKIELCPVRGLPELVREAKEGAAECPGNAREKRVRRESLYAEKMFTNHEVLEHAKHCSVSPEVLRELAGLFAEFDGMMTGFINQYTLRSLLRHLGRSLGTRDLFALLADFRRQGGLGGVNEDVLDFMDIIDIVGYLATMELECLHYSYIEIGGPCSVSVRTVAAALEAVDIVPHLEPLRRMAVDLRLIEPGGDNLIKLSSESDFIQLAALCRQRAKRESYERAGFTHDEVAFFRHAFERYARTKASENELAPPELIKVLDYLNISPSSRTEQDDLNQMIRCADRDVNGTFSFWECLHLVRRFMDKKESVALQHANEAAQEAGLTSQDVDGLHKVYATILDEDTENGGEFNYYALTKAMQLFGANLTMEQNAVLEGVFRQHAKPTRRGAPRRRGDLMGVQTLQLPFPQFLTVVGHLWREDFAGILTASERTVCPEDGSQEQHGTQGFQSVVPHKYSVHRRRSN